MPAYKYKARDASGKSVAGLMEAASKTELIDKLHKMGYITTAVVEAKSGAQVASIFDRFKRIRSDDMLMFYIQLSNMISAGITILMSLSTLYKQIENKKLREAVGGISRQIEAGQSFSQVLSSYPKIFPKLFINMIRAGEASGNLDTVLMRYALFFERQEDLKQKVRGALFYPMILLTFGIIVTLFIVTFVIPKFAEIYLKAGIRLPLPTLVVYKFGTMIIHYWHFIVIFIVLALIGIRFYLKTEKGVLAFDKMKLQMPIIGPLHRKVAISRFTKTLSTLLGSGVPILESLDITKEVIGNRILARVIENVHTYVEKGERMSEPLKVSEEFPPDVVQMVTVGEETGNLDSMLSKIADFYDMNVSYAIKKLTTVIEPIFLLITGSLVGFIMASMLLPMFDMIKTMRH